MVVTILVLLSLLIGLLSLPLIIAGIIFLIMYFKRNKTSKLGIVLPIASICVGELFLIPFSVMFSLPHMSSDKSFTVSGIVSVIIFITGTALLILNAIKAKQADKINIKLFIPSLIIFCFGFFMISEYAAIVAMMIMS